MGLHDCEAKSEQGPQDVALRQAIGARMKQARENLRMVQRVAAEHFDVSMATMNYWEGGQRFPRLEHLVEMVSLYGVSADSLINISSDEQFKQELFMVTFQRLDETSRQRVEAAIEAQAV